jgi:hypothetical protein
MVIDNTLFTVLVTIMILPYPIMIVAQLCRSLVQRDK